MTRATVSKKVYMPKGYKKAKIMETGTTVSDTKIFAPGEQEKSDVRQFVGEELRRIIRNYRCPFILPENKTVEDIVRIVVEQTGNKTLIVAMGAGNKILATKKLNNKWPY